MKASSDYKRIVEGFGDQAAGLIDRILDDESFVRGFCWGVIFCAGLYFTPALINILTR
jgi:hypothetical protein